MTPVVLVTGGAHRVGRALALRLAEGAFAVAVHYRTSREAADETVRALRQWGATAEAFQADLSEPAAPGALVRSVLERFGRLDALVHSASPWIEREVAGVTLDDWESTFRVGPRAGFFLAQAASEELARNDGAILFLSDVAASRAWPRHVPHSAAKAAVDALVRNLAVALAPRVRVNGLAPGIVLPPDDLPAETLERLVKRTPLRRIVDLRDLVDVALMLLQNRSMTGQIVAVDAGRSIV